MTDPIAILLTLFVGSNLIAADPSGRPLVNVIRWFSSTTLDIIGEGFSHILLLTSHTNHQPEASFDFQFRSLDNAKNPLRNDDMIVDTTLCPSWYDLIFKETWRYIPVPLLEYVRYLPTCEYRGFRTWLDNVHKFSRGLIKQSTVKVDGNDIMSVLLRANHSSDPKNKMPDDEMVDQIVCVTYEHVDLLLPVC
ncbi:hypothetical protein EI94DRAFT_1708056 [Lactarius quietus]|nr:hypothetical protein EI94DRAFT_1708056 [Lactarius quietus]